MYSSRTEEGMGQQLPCSITFIVHRDICGIVDLYIDAHNAQRMHTLLPWSKLAWTDFRYYMYVSICSVVMVVGAGRGPLVEATLKAAKSTQRKIRIYAVEKNPGAVNT